MTELFLESRHHPPVTADTLQRLIGNRCGCLDSHRVRLLQVLRADDGHRILTRLEAPDAESVRIALRHTGIDDYRLWSGTLLFGESVADSDDTSGEALERANLVIEWAAFTSALAIWHLAGRMHGPGLPAGILTLASILCDSKTRMVTLVQAREVETLRRYLVRHALPVTRIWRCRPTPTGTRERYLSAAKPAILAAPVPATALQNRYP